MGDWMWWGALVVCALLPAVVLYSGAGARKRLDEERQALHCESEALQRRADELDAERRAFNDEQRAADDALRAERTELERVAGERAAVLDERETSIEGELARVAGLTPAQARQQIIDGVRAEAEREALREAQRIEHEAKAQAESRARKLVVDAVQRVAADQASETVVSKVHLPSRELRGRVIGKEGRNIRAFEELTGATLSLDDQDPVVTLSCFEPVRRETARIALEALVADGAIHPASIEREYAKAVEAMDRRKLDAAEEALVEVGVTGLHHDLLPILGSLAFRTSYGQNVLRHQIECAHLAGVMAAELGLDVAACKRAAFLHDIGKALTHEHEGSHALLGAELLRRHGEDEDTVHAVEAHHNEVEPRTVEALLVQAADAISSSRPGARKEVLDSFVERLEALERIAKAHDGVARAFAIKAGHELRVMVRPEDVDDEAAELMARAIAKEIQATLTYPGQITVTVVRESRATATAS